MAFNSINFILIFLPIFLVLYYVVPKRFRNLVLLVGSFAFYTWGSLDSPLNIALLAVSFVLNFFLGIWIGRAQKNKRVLLVLGLIYNFGMLFVFKYSGFVAENANVLLGSLGVQLPVPSLSLPIGISFYTFQSASYIIDVYRNKMPTERSFVRLGAYVCMFPKLVMGPITTYDTIASDLKKREYSLSRFFDGLREFVIGLGLKVLLAGQISGLWRYMDTMIGPDSVTTQLAWLGVIGFSFQLYFDFCGYSLMAIGLGRMIGFELPQNFNYPYISRSMTEFWRRWHITLGYWFREYVYIPLGGNKKGLPRTIFNLFVVWMLTGIWHGASWNFLIWGALLFVLITIEKLGLKKLLDRYKPLGHIYMIIIIPLSWLIFNVSDLGDLGMYFSRLFPFFGVAEDANINPLDYVSILKDYWVTLLLCILFATALPRRIYENMKRNKALNIVSIVLLALVFAAAMYSIYRGMNDPFLYFKF